MTKFKKGMSKLIDKLKELEKYSFKSRKINFEFHLDNDDYKNAEEMIKGVKVIEINNCNVEFGIENKDEDMAEINFGFGGIEIKKEHLITAFNDWKERDKVLAEADEV